eukprot:1084265-Pelagomonas_calceolata.AAC.1
MPNVIFKLHHQHGMLNINGRKLATQNFPWFVLNSKGMHELRAMLIRTLLLTCEPNLTNSCIGCHAAAAGDR